MTTNIIQGNFINNKIDISNSQYLLNWIGAGGDQKYSDSSGNNERNTINNHIDLSYNIPDNKISFNFTHDIDNNVSIRDAQYIINWNASEDKDSSLNRMFNNNFYSVHEYEYPESKDFICLVIHEDFSFNDEIFHRNKVYLKRKNLMNSITPDTSFSDYILANCIPYLSLDYGTGNIIKRDDIVSDDSGSIQYYKFGFNENGDLSKNVIHTISGEVANNLLNLDISRNVNNLFPNHNLTDIPYYTNLNINHNNANENFYTTNFNSSNIIPNNGVQQCTLDNNNKLSIVDTLCPSTTNLLNNLGFNKTSWFVPGENMNETQGHLIGEFVFDSSASGSMIYQYYYSHDLSGNLPNENSPYNIYLDINGGVLKFPEKWTDVSSGTPSIDHVPWGNKLDGKIAAIYADVFKQPNLYFLYDVSNSINHYKVWENFCVKDASGNASDDGSNWATIISSDDLMPSYHKSAVNGVIGSLLSAGEDMNHSLGINPNIEDSDQITNFYITNNDFTNYPEVEYIWSNTNNIISTSVNNIYNLKSIILIENSVVSIINLIIRTNAIGSSFKLIIPSNITSITTNTSDIFNIENLTTLIFMGDKPTGLIDCSFNNTNLKHIYYFKDKNNWLEGTDYGTTTNTDTLTSKIIPYNMNDITIL